MSSIHLNNTVATEFFELLSLLLAMRIGEYHRKHKTAIEMVSEFIICPRLEDHDVDRIKGAALARKHFEADLSNELFDIRLSGVTITDERRFQYVMTIIPTLLHDEFGELLFVSYRDGDVQLENNTDIGYLESLSDDVLQKAATELKKEIYFRRLKNQ